MVWKKNVWFITACSVLINDTINNTQYLLCTHCLLTYPFNIFTKRMSLMLVEIKPHAASIRHMTMAVNKQICLKWPCGKSIPKTWPNSLTFTFHQWRSGKESICQCRRRKRRGFDPWVWKIPWRRKWHTTPVFLPGKFHGQRSLEDYSPQGRKESDMTERTHTECLPRLQKHMGRFTHRVLLMSYTS